MAVVERDVLARLLPLLRRAGVTVVAGTQKNLVLKVSASGSASQVDLKVVRQRLSRSLANRDAAVARMLYAAPSATPDVVAAAIAGRFDLVTEDPELVIVGGEMLLRSEEPMRRHISGRPAWSRSAVLRVLALTARPLQQSDLAAAISVSQQTVSLALKKLSSTVTRDEHGWIALDGALESWMREYPGPGGTVGYWYGLDDPATQANTALRLLDELELKAVVSGDLAADSYAPWQLPATVRMYLPEIIDFTVAGFSPAEPGDATMTTVVPEDPTVALVAAALGARSAGGHLLADAAITLWDLLNTSTAPTAGEAADRLRDAISGGGFGV
ncbi:hypothetical protein GFY24_18065 [Nocardia sp. SYP-A9097]|uniref:hypothetical protein n=1 Tax=Nocardia sp. SYP-A9097 TaxID=2663237 RepID=UPI00129AB756|nr:hypothetical protein [Nocardia sp. SYP-A9097]MRH89331.1 hypothetical protein [Nocardia sp. SYP-A9097]